MVIEALSVDLLRRQVGSLASVASCGSKGRQRLIGTRQRWSCCCSLLTDSSEPMSLT